jgi:hypothetical protein
LSVAFSLVLVQCGENLRTSTGDFNGDKLMETSLQSKGWSNELLRPAAAQISVANESFPLVVF